MIFIEIYLIKRFLKKCFNVVVQNSVLWRKNRQNFKIPFYNSFRPKCFTFVKSNNLLCSVSMFCSTLLYNSIFKICAKTKKTYEPLDKRLTAIKAKNRGPYFHKKNRALNRAFFIFCVKNKKAGFKARFV